MSRRTMPYHRRYHGDALQGYRRLTLEQRGAYTTILDLIYDEGGPIENNERWLSGELNCSLRKCRALLSELLTLRKLYLDTRGRISNHRAETEIDNALKISRKRAEVASKPRAKVDDDDKFRNKISDHSEQMQSKSAVIPVPEPYNNNIYPEDAERDAPEEQQPGRVAVDPPIPVETLTGNVRLVEALRSRAEGRSTVADLILAQQRRRRKG